MEEFSGDGKVLKFSFSVAVETGEGLSSLSFISPKSRAGLMCLFIYY